MPSEFQDVTEAELAILRCLWEQPGLSVRQIAERIYDPSQVSRNATVLKLLERLERKGYVSRQPSDSVQTFSATIDRDELIGRRLQSVADSLCEGSRVPLLMHLVDSRQLKPEQIEELRRMIEETEQQADSNLQDRESKKKKRPRKKRGG